MLTPYSVIVVFSIGVFLSNFIFNTMLMKKPFVGTPVNYTHYFSGNFSTHLVEVLGGTVWCLCTAFSYIVAGKAGAATSCALGRASPMVAAIWGVFVRKEFHNAPKSVKHLLSLMFLLFVVSVLLLFLEVTKLL